MAPHSTLGGWPGVRERGSAHHPHSVGPVYVHAYENSQAVAAACLTWRRMCGGGRRSTHHRCGLRMYHSTATSSILTRCVGRRQRSALTQRWRPPERIAACDLSAQRAIRRLSLMVSSRLVSVIHRPPPLWSVALDRSFKIKLGSWSDAIANVHRHRSRVAERQELPPAPRRSEVTQIASIVSRCHPKSRRWTRCATSSWITWTSETVIIGHRRANSSSITRNRSALCETLVSRRFSSSHAFPHSSNRTLYPEAGGV